MKRLSFWLMQLSGLVFLSSTFLPTAGLMLFGFGTSAFTCLIAFACYQKG